MSEQPSFLRAPVAMSSIAACPHLIMEPGHYRVDGTCRCDDPTHEMNQWGYRWDGARWRSPDPAAPPLNPAVLQRLADALEVHQGLDSVRQQISELYERGDFHAADPMVTELNDDLGPLADRFAAAAREVLRAAAPHLLPESARGRYQVSLAVSVEAESPEQAAEAFGFHLADTAHPTVQVTNLDTGDTTAVEL